MISTARYTVMQVWNRASAAFDTMASCHLSTPISLSRSLEAAISAASADDTLWFSPIRVPSVKAGPLSQ